MDSRKPVYTEKTECQDCFKCIRKCPVKAIEIEEGRASIASDLCIYCGHCVDVCPTKAKKVRDDLYRAKDLLTRKRHVYVSLSPSYVGEFADLETPYLIAALKRLGFEGVSETALGAQQVSARVAEQLQQGDAKLTISSACPAAVDFVQKYLPDQADCITPILSPVLSHCRLLRKIYGDDIGIVFIGPCAAKKREADRHPDLLDVALTFKDLHRWFGEEGIVPETLLLRGDDLFLPEAANEGALYPIEGGMNETIRLFGDFSDVRFMTLAGVYCINRALTGLKIEELNTRVFVEILACQGSCVHGPCTSKQRPYLLDELEVYNRANVPTGRIERNVLVEIDGLHREASLPVQHHSEEQIRKALRQVGSFKEDDELNCGGCGYDTCQELASALLTGRAEPSMCLSHLRKLAQKKANALLRCIPMSVVIVGADMKIIECNENFIEMFDAEALFVNQIQPGLEGACLEKLVPFPDLFHAVLLTGQDIQRDALHIENKIYNVTIFTIETNQVVGGVILDVTDTEMHREQIAQRAKQVIRKNLETVQEIAFRLGENMADTEILLRSLAYGFSSKDINLQENLEEEADAS
ncbi:MAG TPA: [Fe-Fe] hydrogenase large subunit C-terminal domain-containing protein [Geobacteraceae bacterium]|nr:[Fe-Fe] hydrogenase large subunit C-terminal domain-containing protein [Geobacteraceae bacterium]